MSLLGCSVGLLCYSTFCCHSNSILFLQWSPARCGVGLGGRSPALKILQIRWVQDVGQELPWCCRVEYPQFDAMGRCSARWTIIDTSALLVQDIDVVLGQGPCADPHFFIE
jgi:hypothetical protein